MDGLVIRRPDPERADAEADAAMAVQRAGLRHAMPGLAHPHTPYEDAAWIRSVFATHSVWLAFAGKRLVGVASRRDDTLTQLYVAPDHAGRGIGRRLLECMVAEAPSLTLWTFQRNARARRFYERNGFIAVEATDGRGNEEREPDVRYARVLR